MHTSSMEKPVSSGMRNVVGKSMLKSECDAESDDLKRVSMYIFLIGSMIISYNDIGEND